MKAQIQELADISLHEGYKNIRTAGEMTWSLDDTSKNDLLIEYESELNILLSNSQITLLCQYNENRFDQKFLTEMLRTHPKLIIYGKYYDNPYFYTPPEYMRKCDTFSEKAYKIVLNDIIHA